MQYHNVILHPSTDSQQRVVEELNLEGISPASTLLIACETLKTLGGGHEIHDNTRGVIHFVCLIL